MNKPKDKQRVDQAFQVFNEQVKDLCIENGQEFAEWVPLGGVDEDTRKIMDAVDTIQKYGSVRDQADKRYKFMMDALKDALHQLKTGELEVLEGIVNFHEHGQDRQVVGGIG